MKPKKEKKKRESVKKLIKIAHMLFARMNKTQRLNRQITIPTRVKLPVSSAGGGGSGVAGVRGGRGEVSTRVRTNQFPCYRLLHHEGLGSAACFAIANSVRVLIQYTYARATASLSESHAPHDHAAHGRHSE